ncbi:unnamed protein product [Staurois parvus]|uniref:Uncharacterized protein n=2 Tax=Staurois parvus TaxID=386267 RepID=A0ABN9EGI6_9NEOB|nr:unnamed protein product [Staurois parvus]
MISVAPAVPPVSVHQCHIVLTSSHLSCQSVPYMSAVFQCPSVMPVSAYSSVQPISAHHCSLISTHQ